jgi:eukaryotic-like serine/threonine-protein kinase
MSPTKLADQAIFEIARHIASPDARSTYLDQACGTDSAQRQRIVELLQALEDHESFLESPAIARDTPVPAIARDTPETVDHPSSQHPGQQIGPYKLREQIGEGGMGAVWLAEQSQPIKRRVAIKLIKPGMDSRQVLARFEAERQALTMMDHPNIAKVLDAGSTESSLPYFVMELVKGQPMTQYCDEHRLDAEHRMKLFLDVCQAIQHAHQKGIIHRDIKPSNVLVTEYDGKPVVKVIDFGVAKALHQPLTQRTMFTGLGQIIGTLEYMSPEQARVNQLDIDTRSDVYSLAVLLYELLTGSTPFDQKYLREAALDQILRIIREEEPPKPSTKVSSSDTLPNIAAKRNIEPARLTRLLQGELDWILMKALAKERDRRYETAASFGDDIRRYLNREPVLAGPPSNWYRLSKIMQRNRLAVATTAIIASSLLLGIAGTSWGLLRAEQNRQIAEAREREALREKENAIQAADYERQARQQAMTAIRLLTDELVEKQMSRGSYLTADNRELLDRIAEQFEQIATIAGNDFDSRMLKAEGYSQVGAMRLKLGEIDSALAAVERAIEQLDGVRSDYPGQPEPIAEWVKAQGNLGNLQRALGNVDLALQSFAVGYDLQEQLVSKHPDIVEYRSTLATCEMNLGMLLANSGQSEAGKERLQQAIDKFRVLVSEQPHEAEHRYGLAQTINNLGTMYHASGQVDETRVHFEESLQIFSGLVAEYPNRLGYRQKLAAMLNNMGVVCRLLDQEEETLDYYLKSMEIREQLATEFPNRPDLLDELAAIHNNLAGSYRALKQIDASVDHSRKSIDLYQQLVARFSDDPNLKNNAAAGQVTLAITLHENGDLDEAGRLLDEARPLHEMALSANPEHPVYRRFYSSNLLYTMRNYASLGKADEVWETAGTLKKVNWVPADDYFEAACGMARCVASVSDSTSRVAQDDQERLAARFTQWALDLLSQAVDLGFVDVDLIREDTYLAHVSHHPRFHEILAKATAAE